jgi:hypothetical protein
MVGRRPGSQNGKLRQGVIDALVSLWINPEGSLRFMEIHRGLLKRDIVKNEKQKTGTVRILKIAKYQGLVKHETGSREYFLNVVPEEFRVFDYLQRLREKTETERFQVGGQFWTLCQLYCLGMPTSALLHPDIKSILQVLGVRISRLYQACRVLALEAKKRESLPDISHSIPDDAAREVLIELIPYYLGSFAGCDADGLALEDFYNLLPTMIEALPEEVEPQNPTMKNIILEHVEVVRKLMESQPRREKDEEEFVEEKPKDFALLIVPPEDVADSDEYEKRWIKQELEKYAAKPSLYIASNLLMFKKENVDNVLDIYGRKFLGARKLNETRDLYEKTHASDEVDRLINGYDFYPEEDKRKAKQMIMDLTENHGRKSIIVYLAFSRSGMCWFLPTPKKEKHLQKFFPRHSRQEIHDWLAEGADLHKPLADEKFNDLKKEFEVLLKADKT